MEFLDREQSLPPVSGEPPEPRLGGAERRRQFMVRRLVALVGVILLIVLLVVGVRGCLDARKTRAFENYQRDVSAIAEESNQLSNNFFGRLSGSNQQGDLSFEAQVNADRGQAETLLARILTVDSPDELAPAQRDLEFAFELRRDGLAEIAAQLPNASGDRGVERAMRRITRQMEVFLASDVLYRRGRMKANQGFVDANIAGELPNSRFLPQPPPDWLDQTTVANAISAQVGGGGGDADVTGVHGLGLLDTQTTVNGVAVTPGAETTVPAAGETEISVQVQNQGESEESDIGVNVSLGGANGAETISSIQPGETQTVTVPISPAPPTGQSVTLDVSVDPVPGEQVEDNNSAQYSLLFQ